MEDLEVRTDQGMEIVPPPTDDDFSDVPSVKSTEATPVVSDKPVESSQYNPAWDYLKAKGLEIPENVIKGEYKDGESEMDYLVGVIAQATRSQLQDDDFVEAYRKAPDKEEFIRSYRSINDIINLTPEEGIKHIYRSEVDSDGNRVFTEEQITEELGKMSMLQKKREWEEYKKGMQENHMKTAQDASAKSVKPSAERIAQEESRRMRIIDQILEEDAKVEEYGGIPYTQEMKAQFGKDFREMNKINPETGIPIFNEMLSDNKILIEVMRAYSLFKDGKIKHYLSSEKEAYKDSILDKTSLNPIVSGGTSKVIRGNRPEDYD